MKLTDWFKTREGALSENKWGRIIILVQMIVILVMAFGMANQRQAVVLVPPNLEERTSVQARQADAAAKTAWALYIANTIGNVTPSSSQFLTETISRHLSPRIYRSVIEGIDAQARQLREEQISLQFIPTVARYEAEIDRVVVSGELIERGLRNAERRSVRSYEMGFIVRNYRVLLDSMRVMEGEWRRETPAEGDG
ncbi:MAG: hypothetical protein DDT34_01470 [Firmicutes bacterium]|nr:hypothetical protein [Bacillota bacterium]